MTMTTNTPRAPSPVASRPPRQRSAVIQNPDGRPASSPERPAGPRSDAASSPRLSELRVVVDRDATFVTLVVSGALDTYTVDDFRTAAERHTGTSDDIVVDLDGVSLIDSAGLHTLRRLSNRAHASGQRLSLVCQRKHVVSALAIAGLKGSITAPVSSAQVASILPEQSADRVAPQPLFRMPRRGSLHHRIGGSGSRLTTAGATPTDNGKDVK